MEAKEYLEQIKKNERIIANKRIEKQYWLDMAQGTSVKLGGDRVQTSSNKHPMESQVLEAVTIDEEIARLKEEIAGIIKTIEQLNTEDYCILHKMYVQHLSMKEIQVDVGMSYSWVSTTKNRALRNLQRILDA